MADKTVSGVQSGAAHNARGQGEIKDWLVGRVLGKYELVKPIGFGSFASIYEAVHVHLRVPFAIKVLHPTFINHEEVVKRFFREGQAASQLQHENVVFIADFDVEEDVGPYIVMEYLEGDTLKTHIANKGPLPLEEVGEIARQITQALSLAHSKGIIHRDLKPENIFLVPRGTGRSLVKILDFGIAHLADCSESITGARLLGTPVYMAPEQFRGETHSNSLDIYSFGVLMYEMLTGKPPFKGQNVQQLGIEHLLIPAPPLEDSFPEALRQIQAQLLSKNASERPASMEEAWSSLAIAIDPNHAFTHWHQQAIDPLTAAKLLSELPPKPAVTPSFKKEQEPTDTVIESLEGYDFPQSAEVADTARDKTPVMLDEGESGAKVLSEDLSPNNELSNELSNEPTNKHAPPNISASTNEATQIAPTPKRPKSADTADEGAIISQIEADLEAQEALPPLPPIDIPNTTVTPIPANGGIDALYTQDFITESTDNSTTQPGGSPPKTSFPPLSPSGSNPRFPFPGSTPPPRSTHPSLRQSDPLASITGSQSRVFGNMGNREKRTLMILWLLVIVVVVGVAFFIVNSIPNPATNKSETSQKTKKRKGNTHKSKTHKSKAHKSKTHKTTHISHLQIIHLKSTPSGATVMENEVKIGVTPFKIERHIGFVSVFTFKYKGYADLNIQHRVTNFKTHTIHKVLQAQE